MRHRTVRSLRYARKDLQENRHAEQNQFKASYYFERITLASGQAATYGNDLVSLGVVEGAVGAGTAAQELVEILGEH